MNTKKLTPRQRQRLSRNAPAGVFAGLFTAAAVTLIGVVSHLQPSVILIRAAVSAALIGFLVSFGLGIVRMPDAEYKRRVQNRTRRAG